MELNKLKDFMKSNNIHSFCENGLFDKIKPRKYQITFKGKKGRNVISYEELLFLLIACAECSEKTFENVYSQISIKSLQTGNTATLNYVGQLSSPLTCMYLNNKLKRTMLTSMNNKGK